MNRTTDPEPKNLARVTTHRKKNFQTGKVCRGTFIQLPANVVKRAGIRRGATYAMVIATDGTITLSPVPKAGQVDEQRQAEFLEALEKTNQQFGNVLRRLAQ